MPTEDKKKKKKKRKKSKKKKNRKHSKDSESASDSEGLQHYFYSKIFTCYYMLCYEM